MNRKTIDKVIKQKLSDWLLSIDDQSLIKAIEEDVIVTGGCIASMLMREPVNDYDLYFRTKSTAKKVAEYYCRKFNKNNNAQAFVLDGEDLALVEAGKKSMDEIEPGYKGEYASAMLENCGPERIKIIVRSSGVAAADDKEEILEEPFENVVDALSEADSIPEEKIEEKERYRPVFLSTNAITLSGKIQLVIRFYGEAKDIHENYDFVHCMNCWTYSDGLELKAEALEAILSKELIYRGSKYPLCSIIRTRKFIKRGFNINAGQYLKMGFQLSKLDLTDIDVLEDQLVGVDSAYFMILIDGLRNKMKSDPSFKIEEGYVSSIIDKIF